MKSKLWYVKWPGGIYAEGPYRFEESTTERQFRAHLRDRLEERRLPAGTEVWPTTDADIDIVGRSNRAPGT